LPSKVLLKIGNKRIIDLIYDRIKSVKTINDIIFAIPNNNLNKNLFERSILCSILRIAYQ